jgi:hypothetical protein
MIIVIEGPDGAGKTTLAKQLAHDLKLDYHHEGPPPKGLAPWDHYGRILEDARRDKKDLVIDRFAYGERVYGPILRSKDTLGHTGWKLMVRLMRACGVVTVYCLPEYEVCYQSWASGRAELVRDEQKFKLSYDIWLDHIKSQTDYSGIIYDYTNWRYSEFFHFLRRHALKDSPKPLPLGVIGEPTAKYLFVGDIGSNPSAYVDLPFWSDTGSSDYLNDALIVAGFTEREIALLNSRRHDGQYQQIPQDKVWYTVALGNNASRELTKREIMHRTVPHPQYWKRFHHADIQGYANKLKAATGRP